MAKQNKKLSQKLSKKISKKQNKPLSKKSKAKTSKVIVKTTTKSSLQKSTGASSKNKTQKVNSKTPAKSITKTASKSSNKPNNSKLKHKATKVPSVSKSPKLIPKPTAIDFVPLGDRVLIKQGDGFSQTASGLYIPEAYQEKPLQGHVVRVGAGPRNKKGVVRPLDVKVGDEVLFTKFAGSKVQVEGQSYLILAESDIIGIVTKN